MSSRVTGAPSFAVPSGSVARFEFHGAGQSIGDYERRGSQIIGAHIRIDAALEIAVAGKHGRDDEVLVVHSFRNRLGQRPGIADAGGAAIADKLEAERVQYRPAAPSA